jgi:hypothetical protein
LRGDLSVYRLIRLSVDPLVGFLLIGDWLASFFLGAFLFLFALLVDCRRETFRVPGPRA